MSREQWYGYYGNFLRNSFAIIPAESIRIILRIWKNTVKKMIAQPNELAVEDVGYGHIFNILLRLGAHLGSLLLVPYWACKNLQLQV